MRVCAGLSGMLIASALLAGTATAATMQGTVRDANGNTVPDAHVWLWQSGEVAQTSSSADGAFRFDALEVGVFHLVVLHPDHALDGATGFAAGDSELTIFLRPAAEQSVHVVDDGFRDLGGARIHRLSIEGRVDIPVSDLVPHGFPELRSGDDGLIAMKALPANGFVRLIVRHFKYADTYVPFMPVRGTTDDVQLIPGIRIAGRVAGPSGPVEGAQVLLYRLTPQGQQEVATARSDGDGLYSARVAPGPYLVSARHADFAPAQPARIEAAGNDDAPALDFTLASPRRISGSIVGEKTSPIPAARIQWLKDDVIYDETYSDGAGEFSLSVADAEGLLRILPPAGYMTEDLDTIPVDMGTKDSVVLSPIRLLTLPIIEGIVRDPDGDPVPNALVSATNLSGALWLVCDTDGKFYAQLRQMPETKTVEFIAEHPQRFNRAAFSINTRKVKAADVTLEAYTPDPTRIESEGPGNDLEKLLDEPAPAFECREWFNLGDAEAPSATLFEDKITVLTFWGGFDQTPAGVNEIERIRALQAALAAVNDVQFLSIHDGTSEASEVESYLEGFGVTFPVGLDADPFVTFDRYGINFIPDTILIDKAGKVAHVETGDRILEFIKLLRR